MKLIKLLLGTICAVGLLDAGGSWFGDGDLC